MENRPAPNLGSLGADDFVSQHALGPARDLKSRLDTYPRVMIAILAKQKEKALPLFLQCIEGLDYPKAAIFLYVRTNNNHTDRTEQILRDWIERVRSMYAGVEFDAQNVPEKVEQYGEHEWNATRFHVLGHIRNISIWKALEHGCNFYFVCDVDTFIRPETLSELVSLNLPIVAPLLRVIDPRHYHSNYFAEVSANGYYVDCDQYKWIAHRWVRGIFEVPLVHCTYLIRDDVIPRLRYLDGTDRHEFLVFSESARKVGIPQYLDNRQLYGYMTFNRQTDVANGNIGAETVDEIAIAKRALESANVQEVLASGNIDRQVNPRVVRAAFRAILGREPESADTIRWHLEHAAGLEELLRLVINNEELKLRAGRGGDTLQTAVLNLLSDLSPRNVVGHRKIRVGNQTGDGGYVMLDDFEGIVGAISAGIGGDVSWDQEIADRGIDVFQVDHSVGGPPAFHDRFHFFRRRLSSEASEGSESINSLIGKVPVPDGRLIFKMDIEGAEWEALDAASIDDFRRVAQLVIEFHGFSNLMNADWRMLAIRTIAKLNSVFQVAHVHANNYSPLQIIANVPIAEVIEVTFVNRLMYEFEDAAELYPTPIDRPNRADHPDIFLGSMRFPGQS